MDDSTILGRIIGKSIADSNDYRQDFIETEQFNDINIVNIDSVNVTGSYFVYSQDIGNMFVLGHPVNGNLGFDSNLKGFYNFEGNALDVTGHGRDGTLNAVTLVSSGINGSAYNFNGTTSYIELSDSSDFRFNNGGTISAWVYPTSAGGLDVGRIIDKSTTTGAVNGYNLRTNAPSGSNIAFAASIEGSTIFQLPSSWSTYAWHHVVFTFNSSVKKIYVDGVNVASSSITGMPNNIAGAVRIGARAGTNDRNFRGAIDELGLWNRMITDAEVIDLYNSGIGYVYPYSIAHGFQLGRGLRSKTLSYSGVF